MGREYEWKFKATPEDLAAIEAAYAGETEKISMETTYYDTPTGKLSALRYTLRRRLENGVSVCTLKVPAGDARGEWEVNSESIASAIAMLVAAGCPEELPLLVQEGLVPVCGAKFTRIAKTVAVQGAVLELALDQGYLFGGSAEAPLCEVEVELKSGTTAMCDQFAQALAEEFLLKTEEKSKFSRGLALYRGE